MAKKTHLLCQVFLIVGCIVLFVFINYWINANRKEKQNTFFSGTEYVKTIDCAPIFDANPMATYAIDFEIKAEKPGDISVYQMDNGLRKYGFTEHILVTEEFQTFHLEVKPVLVDADVSTSFLSFYGEYGSGVIPTIKYISVTCIE